ncbi:MAG: DUF1697 domain-containing protein [Candidatus Saccharimonadales bacterium]
MSQTYLALIRGINVGGHHTIRMMDLVTTLNASGLINCQSYIQSGNIIFNATQRSVIKLSQHIEKVLSDQFNIRAKVAVFTMSDWESIIKQAPCDWGVDTTWKHNLLVLVQAIPSSEVAAAIGTIKPDIEILVPGNRVLYQSMSRTQFGKTTTGKLANNPIYQIMTVRNFNTATKLLHLMKTHHQLNSNC